MGVVYRARDSQLGREVALKTILADKEADRDFVSRFRREALSIAQIDHPNIVSLLDFVEGDPTKGEISYMVMEYLKGKDLGALIKEHGPFEITRAVDRILEVCAAVGTCHRRNFVHRDLKPTNIFITAYDHIETAKVLDFGVAKLWAENVLTGRLAAEDVTQHGLLFGTPHYMAPELLKGQPATPKGDQYAIAVVLYVALTGRKPFIASPDADIPDLDLWQAIAQGRHTKPREMRDDIPTGLEDAIERAMSINPEDRFRHVQELGAHLLPWASPAANHRWTAHFTSAPTAREPPLHTEIDSNTRTMPLPPDQATTADGHSDRRSTRLVGTDELLLAGEPDAAGARRPFGAELARGAPGVAAPSTDDGFHALLGRPMALIAVGSLALASAVGLTAFLRRSEPVRLGQSSALLGQETPLAEPAPIPVSPPGGPVPPDFSPKMPLEDLPLKTDPQSVAPASTSRTDAAPITPLKPHRKHQKHLAVDRKGFPIPSD